MARGRPAISLCVAVYRAHEAPNIASLCASVPASADGLDVEVVVALNGISAADAGVPDSATAVPLDRNHGVPIAWNRAGQAASGDVLVFLNDDVALRPLSLRRLYDALTQHGDAGVVGPSPTVWDMERLQHRAYVAMDGRPAGALVECDVVSGYCFATRRETYEAVGGFDEALTPCGFEEVDFCTAVRTDLGLRCFGVAGSDVEHEFGISARPPETELAYLDRRETLGAIATRNRAHIEGKWRGRAAAGTRVGWLDRRPQRRALQSPHRRVRQLLRRV